MEPRPVYLDHNATTPLDPRVRDAMLPWLGERWGNASSIHRFGQAANGAVEEAREKVAALLGVRPLDVVFTASGTEANNAVVFGVAAGAPGVAAASGRLVISAFEHPSIEAAAARLEAWGLEVVRVRPGADGVVPAAAVLEAVTPATRLVALMLANNELGTLQPVAEVAAACRDLGIPVLCDAVQAAGKVPVDAEALGVDFLVIGGHKFHGPLGAAALWVRPDLELDRELPALLVGGGQERRRRAGTPNVPAVVGLGEAAALATAELPAWSAHLAALRDRFEAGLSAIPGATVHCAQAPRLPNTSHVAFPGIEGEALLVRLDLAGYAVSTGSACSSGTVEPSRASKALGLPVEEALSSLRISFGRTNTLDEVDRFLEALAREASALAAFGPATLAAVGTAGFGQAAPAAVGIAGFGQAAPAAVGTAGFGQAAPAAVGTAGFGQAAPAAVGTAGFGQAATAAGIES